jgi:hypothetical protein
VVLCRDWLLDERLVEDDPVHLDVVVVLDQVVFYNKVAKS